MIDCTSSLYLGMTHPSSALGRWSSLTTGKPALLGEAPDTTSLEQALALLQGSEQVTLAPSTLHLIWDLFGLLAAEGTAVLVDDGAYEIARWGAERARQRGALVRTFRHHDVRDLLRKVGELPARCRVLVVSDGFCPSCGNFAPLTEYDTVARSRDGALIVDDTQALGVFGRPAPYASYGAGGGGSLLHLGVRAKGVLVLASLAKGFGAPIAALSAAREVSFFFRSRSGTRVHCSPPSSVVTLAAAHALWANANHGEALRAKLAENVRRFKGILHAGGVASRTGLFPVVRLCELQGVAPATLNAALELRGVRSFIQARCMGGTQLAVILRADQQRWQIEQAAAALLGAVSASRRHRHVSQQPSN